MKEGKQRTFCFQGSRERRGRWHKTEAVANLRLLDTFVPMEKRGVRLGSTREGEVEERSKDYAAGNLKNYTEKNP